MKQLLLIFISTILCNYTYSQYICGVTNNNSEGSLRSYSLCPSKWNKTNLTYYINNTASSLTATQRETAIDNAFDTWASNTVLTFTQVYNESNADLKISWKTEANHGDDMPFGPLTLAHAFYPPPAGGSYAGELHFNDAWIFNVNGTEPDLESTALHEIGHLIGLNHSDNVDAIMQKLVYYRRSLHIEDCMAAWDMYGCPFSISGSEVVLSANTYSINWSFPSSITITWSVNNPNFILTPSDTLCSVTCNTNTNEEAILTATITLNGQSVSIQKQITHAGAINGNSFVDNEVSFQIPNLPSDYSTTWSVSNNAFSLSPFGSQCVVSSNQNEQYEAATLSVYIWKNGGLVKNLSKQIFHIGNIRINSINSSQAIYELKNLPSDFTVNWYVDNSAFSISPSGNFCSTSVPSSYQEATLRADVTRNGTFYTTLTKSILSQATALDVDGTQWEYTSASGMYPEQTFTINVPNALNGYSSDSISVNADCDISLVSDRFKGMNITFDGNSNVLPTDIFCMDDCVDFHLQDSSTPYTLTLKAQKEGGYYDFNLNFTVSPIPELYQMYYEDDPELVLNLSGNALNILLTNVQGTEVGGGLIQQATWYLRIYRAQTGAQVYSQTIHAPFTDVYVNNYVNGLYIVTAIYNGNTYHAKVYINH